MSDQPILGIIIAKDHESSGFKAALAEHAIPIEEIVNDIKLEKFVLQTIEETHQITCVATYLNNQGPGIEEHTRKFVDIVRPRYLITIGVCGSTQPPGTVMFFSEAQLLTGEKVSATTVQYGHKETSRAMPSSIKVADPHKVGTCVFTSDKVEEDVETCLAQHRGCSAVDMEIGVVFKTIMAINEKRTKSTKTFTLHAIKAVSDKGGKAERDANKHSAIKDATEVLIAYVRFLLQHNHLTPAVQAISEPSTSAPAPKGNSGATYANYAPGGGGYVNTLNNNWAPKK